MDVISNIEKGEGRKIMIYREDLNYGHQAYGSPELAQFVKRCWSAAKQAKAPIERALYKCLRQRNGEYESDKRKAIQQMGGSDIFMLLTKTKCKDAESWVRDILFQPELKPWDMSPTPLEELPADIEQFLFEQAYKKAHKNGAASGASPNDVIRQYLEEEKRDFLKNAAQKMNDKIHDQFTEGGWYKALDELIYDIVTFKAGFIKGPALRKEAVRNRAYNETSGAWETTYEDRLVAQYERRSPFDIYPSPQSCGINDGYLIDRLTYTHDQLETMIGLPGFNDAAITALLYRLRSEGIDAPKSALFAENVELGITDVKLREAGKIEVIEFWGLVQGRLLLEFLNVCANRTDTEEPNDSLFNYWLMNIEPDSYYHSCVWLCRDYVLKVMLNPDPLGHKPFSKASFEEIPGSFWGNSLCEHIADIQSACNAVSRAIINNIGIASGPQVERNIDRIPQGQTKEIWPWKVWDTTDSQMSGAPAITFYQPDFVVDKLISVYDFFLKRADEQSGIPSYSDTGTLLASQASSTASGLSMLITNTARGIKALIKNIDNKVIKTSVERQYYHNLDYENDMTMIPDMKVTAKGSSSLIAKEQQAIRRREFLQATNNPVDLQILGTEGRKNLLKEVARALELDVDSIINGSANTNTAQQETEPIADKTKSLNSAGEPSSGEDFKLFNPKKEVSS
ncbi:hypothetical protein MCHI_003374 [Candidatus Magnetoovum chiemensis]|nr:hypothetical protein MCHI_003374 [Candidatus Magnetoovum chiemensis]